MFGKANLIAPHENDTGLVVSFWALNWARTPGEPRLEWFPSRAFVRRDYYARGCQHAAEAIETRTGRQSTG